MNMNIKQFQAFTNPQTGSITWILAVDETGQLWRGVLSQEWKVQWECLVDA